MALLPYLSKFSFAIAFSTMPVPVTQSATQLGKVSTRLEKMRYRYERWWVGGGGWFTLGGCGVWRWVAWGGAAHLADAFELRLRREAEVDEVARHRVVVLGVDVGDELDQRVPAQRA